MKKRKLMIPLALFAVACLSSCENVKMMGNHNVGTGNMSYWYAYVKSSCTAPAYYHICIWKEYGPDDNFYVGLEFETYSTHTYYYFYEFELSYVLTREYVPTFGTAVE
jgi:hypothetical protein